jgi:hypothetical protein
MYLGGNFIHTGKQCIKFRLQHFQIFVTSKFYHFYQTLPMSFLKGKISIREQNIILLKRNFQKLQNYFKKLFQNRLAI